MARSLGLKRLAVPTQGNAGDSLAEYAVAAGIEAVIVMSPDTDLPVLGKVAAYAYLYPDNVKLDWSPARSSIAGNEFANIMSRKATSASPRFKSPVGVRRGRKPWGLRWRNRRANACPADAGNSRT